MSRRLDVLLHGTLVGGITEASDGSSDFRFYETYFDSVPRPVLGQSFEDDLRHSHRSRPRERLPDFFANLAPEGRLRELLQQTAEIEPADDLALLAYVGGDLPGAVVIHPFRGEGLPSGDFPRWNAAGTPAGVDDEDEGLRFSLAGVQLKLSMLREGEKLTLPIRDRAGDWIVKFDSPSFPHLPENEYSMLEWARAARFDVPECHLHDLDNLDEKEDLVQRVRGLVKPNTRLLAVRRYDRVAGERVHQEDFTQAVGLPPDRKFHQVRYEQMATLARQFINEDGVDEFVRRLALVVATGNNDAHLKNWSLIYPDRVRAEWSPLYDQVATIAWEEPKRALALKLAGVKDFARIDREAFARFADSAGVDRRRVEGQISETLERLRDVWPDLGHLPLVPAHRRAIEEHWKRVPLLRRFELPR